MRGSQESLIARAQAGDRPSFDRLVADAYTLVYNTAYRVLGDQDLAADATQMAFLRAYRSLPSFRGQSSFTTWLYRIVTNVCLDMVRAQRRQAPAVSTLGDETEPYTPDQPDERLGPEARVLQGELQAAVHGALARLRPEHRLVLVLYDLAGFPYEEIATMLDLPLGTVKSRLNRARNSLREEMTGYWELSQ